jgi:hypothetical protein
MRKAARLPLRRGDASTLHWASERGYVRVVKGLLESGAAVNIVDSLDDTPLMLACRFGHENIVEHLIIAGADVDFTSNGGETAFTCAARFNHPSVMDLMFRLGAKVDSRHWWILISAAAGGRINVARLLLEHGVDVNFQLGPYAGSVPKYTDEYIRQSAVYMAVLHQHPDMVELLVNYGADVDALNGRVQSAVSTRQYFISRWSYLSPAEEKCLLALCKGSKWQKRRWKTWWCLKQVLIFLFFIITLPLWAIPFLFVLVFSIRLHRHYNRRR